MGNIGLEKAEAGIKIARRNIINNLRYADDSVLPTVKFLSKLESVFSNPAAPVSTELMEYSKCFVVMSTVFTASSPGIELISRNHFVYSFITSDSSSMEVV